MLHGLPVTLWFLLCLKCVNWVSLVAVMSQGHVHALTLYAAQQTWPLGKSGKIRRHTKDLFILLFYNSQYWAIDTICCMASTHAGCRNVSNNQQQSFSGVHYTNPDDQPTTNTDSPGSPTTVLLRTTPTRTITQPQTLIHLVHKQQQSFSGLHQPRRSTNHKHWLTWVTTNNSPSQDYTNPDDQPTTNIDSPGSQPTTVLLRTTPTWTINQPQTLTHLVHNQNSPSQDYTNPDDQPTTNIDSPGSQPTKVPNFWINLGSPPSPLVVPYNSQIWPYNLCCWTGLSLYPSTF